MTTDNNTLPPLPESRWHHGARCAGFPYYTAEQMHEYARAALASAPSSPTAEPPRWALEFRAKAAEAERDTLRRALAELVFLKGLKARSERLMGTDNKESLDLLADYAQRKEPAWKAARAALASASPPTPGSGPVDWDEIAGGERLAWGNDAATFNAGVDAMLAAVKRAAGSVEQT